MQRVLVIGAGGAGKSTVAERLGAVTKLPVVHLDALYWRPGWNPTPAAAWQERVAALVAEPAWIMDGNYGGTRANALVDTRAIVRLRTAREVERFLGDVARRTD